MRIFRDRIDGGHELARHLAHLAGEPCVVYGLPRGGVITAKVVADTLHAPLDLIIARKIGHPDNPEYAIGAITDDGDIALDEDEAGTVPPQWLEAEEGRQLEEARRRRGMYLADRPPVPVEGKTAILVDDGIATGYTMEAAVMSIRKRNPLRIVVAAPVASVSAVRHFEELVDAVIVAETPEPLYAIGVWYDDFSPVADEEVLAVTREALRVSNNG